MRHSIRTGSLLSLALIGAIVVSLAPTATLQQSAECTREISPDESIQAAIDEAEAGAVLCLVEGTWTEHLTIKKRLTVRGTGEEPSVVEAKEGERPVMTIDSAEAIDVVIESLTLTEVVRGNGLRVAGSAEVTIRDSTVSVNRLGILLRDSSEAEIRNSTVSENFRGIQLENSAQVEICTSTASENGFAGIDLFNSSEATIRTALSPRMEALLASGFVTRLRPRSETTRSRGTDLRASGFRTRPRPRSATTGSRATLGAASARDPRARLREAAT